MSNRKHLRKNSWDRSSSIGLAALGLVFLGILAYNGYHAYWDLKINKPEWKTGFHADFPGLPADLLEARRAWVVQKANKEPCSCRCGFTLASCLKGDLSCPIRSQNFTRLKELVSESEKTVPSLPQLFRPRGVEKSGADDRRWRRCEYPYFPPDFWRYCSLEDARNHSLMRPGA